jgi:hypothetical protein
MLTSFTGADLIPDSLALLLFLAALLISSRALYIYFQVRNPRLFILGVAMGIVALTALADLISTIVTAVTLNTDWFLYIGQSASFLFILLSLAGNDDEYFQKLMRVQVLVSALLIGLMLLSPTLPSFSNILLKSILSGSRCVICFGIFYFYASAFMKKHTRFSLLMSISFALLAFGYLMIVQQYFIASGTFFDNEGDIIRMVGLVTLLIAVFGG